MAGDMVFPNGRSPRVDSCMNGEGEEFPMLSVPRCH